MANELIRELPTRSTVLMVFGLGFGFAWWNLLHEIAFYYVETYEAQANNCFLGFDPSEICKGSRLLLS